MTSSVSRHVLLTLTLACVGLSIPACSSSSDTPSVWEPLTGLYARNLTALVAPSEAEGVLLAGLASGDVFLSTNAGRSWGKRGTIPGGPAIHTLAFRPDRRDLVFAATEAGLFLSADSGRSWTERPLGPPGRVPCRCISFDPWKPALVYAGTHGYGVFRSTDGGVTWQGPDVTDTLLTGSTVNDLVVNHQKPDEVFAAVIPTGILASRDAGRTWNRLTWEFTSLGAAVTRLAIQRGGAATLLYGTNTGAIHRSTNGGHTWSPTRQGSAWGTITSLVSNPRSPETVYAGTESGISLSTDFGASWRELSRALPRVPTTFTLQQRREAPHFFAWGAGTGLLRSENGGQSWRPVDVGLGGATVHLVTADAERKRVYAGIGPSLCMYTSESGMWTATSNGLPAGALFSIHRGTSDNDRIYACTPAGVFRTTDGGLQWEPFARGARTIPRFFQTHPLLPTRMFLSGEHGLFVSTDGGTGWTEARPWGKKYEVTGMIFSKTNAGSVAASAADKGVITSSDGGLNWDQGRIALSGDSVRVLTRDDAEAGTMYAWSHRGTCYRSIDAGMTWERFSTPWGPAAEVLVSVDRTDPASVLALVNSSTLYYSSSGGTRWSPVPTLRCPAGAITLLWDLQSRTAYIGTRDRGVYVTRIGEPEV